MKSMILKNIDKQKYAINTGSCAWDMWHIPTPEKELSKFQLLSHTGSFR